MVSHDEMARVRHRKEPVELLLSDRHMKEINFQDNVIRDMQCREISGKAVRIIRNGRIGTASGTVDTPLEKLLDTAAEFSRYAGPCNFSLPEGDGKLQESHYEDPSVQSGDIAFARCFVEKLIRQLESELPEWSLSGGAVVGAAVNRLVTSRGIDQRYEERAGCFNVTASLSREGDIPVIVTGRSTFPDAAAFESMVEDFVWRARQAETGAVLSAGEYPVLLHPETLDCFLDAFEQAINGRMVYEHVSPLQDSIGKQVFNPKVTIVDDPLDTSLAGYSPFGDEGTPAEKHTLVDGGALHTFLTNLEYAERLGQPHTGHGKRFPGIFDDGWPSGHAPIAGSSQVMEAGDTSFEDMMKSISDGVYLVESWDIWSGNLISGEISGSTHLAYRVVNGRIAGRIKDMRVSGNIYSLLGDRLAALSKERPETAACALRAPFLLLDRVRIA
jgi:PmbA protein